MGCLKLEDADVGQGAPSEGEADIDHGKLSGKSGADKARGCDYFENPSSLGLVFRRHSRTSSCGAFLSQREAVRSEVRCILKLEHALQFENRNDGRDRRSVDCFLQLIVPEWATVTRRRPHTRGDRSSLAFVNKSLILELPRATRSM